MTRTLLPYQTRWVQDPAPLAVIEKSRRIGLSWAEAYAAVLHAAEGRGDVYYQSYAKDMTRTFIDDCADWAGRLEPAAAAVDETLIDLGDADAIQAFQLRLATGRRVVAMTSAPRAFRSKGRNGDLAIIDEAAWVDDLEAVLKAALAFRVWGGRVHVISTHHGDASPFAALVRDVREGRVPGALHTVTLTDALGDGLYRRICQATGQVWSPAAEAAWEAELRSQYGAAAAEELDCVPAAGGGAWLAWQLLRAAEHAEAGDPARTGGGPVYLGVDIARRRDLWVAVAVERVGDVCWVRELRAHQGISFAAQADIIADLSDRYRPVRIAVDQTGMGEAVVEAWQGRFGRTRVEGVLLTGPRRLDLATTLREALEDRRLRLPDDEALRRDLHAVRADTGPTGAPRLVAERSGTDGHADRFWAVALAMAAAATAPACYRLHRLDDRRDRSQDAGWRDRRRPSPVAVGTGFRMRWQPGGLL